MNLARVLYQSAEDGKDYRKEIANIYASLGEIDMEKGDFESSVFNYKKCMELRQQLFPQQSRPIADCYFFIGLAQKYLAQNNALLSRDDPELRRSAEANVKESAVHMKQAHSIIQDIAVARAVEAHIASPGRWQGGVIRKRR